MNKRETALEIIRIEYAKYGKETRESMRAYVENRISLKARNKAVRAGLDTYSIRDLHHVWKKDGEVSYK